MKCCLKIMGVFVNHFMVKIIQLRPETDSVFGLFLV